MWCSAIKYLAKNKLHKGSTRKEEDDFGASFNKNLGVVIQLLGFKLKLDPCVIYN